MPNPLVDIDDRFSDTGVPAKRNYLETVKGRPDVVCGLSGSNAARITDCATRNTNAGVNKAIWEGSKYGQGGEGDWKLVTLYKASAAEGDPCSGGIASGCYEVWRDERTGLTWSDSHTNNGNNYNWFQAAGYSAATDTSAVTSYDGSPGAGYQPAVPISVCADATAIACLNGIATYQNPDGTNGTTDERPAKGDLTGLSRGWRLPTRSDWSLAEANGVRMVLPNMDTRFWSMSSLSRFRSRAWFFEDELGSFGTDTRDILYLVRCVGR